LLCSSIKKYITLAYSNKIVFYYKQPCASSGVKSLGLIVQVKKTIKQAVTACLQQLETKSVFPIGLP